MNQFQLLLNTMFEMIELRQKQNGFDSVQLSFNMVIWKNEFIQ